MRHADIVFAATARHRRKRLRTLGALIAPALLMLVNSCTMAPAPRLAVAVPPVGAAMRPLAPIAADRPAGEGMALVSAVPTAVTTTPAAPFLVRSAGSDAARAQVCLTTAIYYEAASEPEDGQRAVAQVVLNRVRHPAFPNSVCGVVFQGWGEARPCQFSFACDGAMARLPSDRAWKIASRIAREALAGAVFAPVGHAVNYHRLDVSPGWARRLVHVGVFGVHAFYALPGAQGGVGAFVQRAALREPMPAPRSLTVQSAALLGADTAPILSGVRAQDGGQIQPVLTASGAAQAEYATTAGDAQILPRWRDSGTVIAR